MVDVLRASSDSLVDKLGEIENFHTENIAFTFFLLEGLKVSEQSC